MLTDYLNNNFCDWLLFHILSFVLELIIEPNCRILNLWCPNNSVSLLFLDNYQRAPPENGQCPYRPVGKFNNTFILHIFR